MNRQNARFALAIVMTCLFPVIYYYLSPYLIIQAASEGVIAGDLIVFAGLFLSSLFLGRAWCGWLCPGGATQEICSKVNNKCFNGKKRNLIKYFIWAPWVSLIVVVFARVGKVKAIDPLYQTYYGLSIHDLQSVIMFAIVGGAIAIFALAAGKRAACHTICWMAPFMIIGRKLRNFVNWPSLQLEADSGKCISCKTCNRNCPMSLDVNAMVDKNSMENAECLFCGTCVDGCPRHAIKFTFGKIMV